jgi:hypothetical protein
MYVKNKPGSIEKITTISDNIYLCNKLGNVIFFCYQCFKMLNIL